eukprot:TRINITY_DN25068_c0_g1_i1.p1 TRINITY_DN25068_c0_g1~~TRINITY_DN25068_c0_g1_i1.p1  ORF type:complete len:489 (+),score=104.39 TRINITY_DN25068_c0_g1_i1:23-1468(+)
MENQKEATQNTPQPTQQDDLEIQLEEQKEDSKLKNTDEPPSLTSFDALPVYDWIKTTLANMGMKKPTPIQQYTLIPALKGRNVIGAASTGSGKTLCFAVPIIQNLAADPYGVHSLVLTPTRELASQIADQFRAVGSKMNIRVQTVVGGLDMLDQTAKLQKIPHVVVATPGRLLHILSSGNCPGFTLKRIKFLVLDEADQLLSEDFREQFTEIMKEIPKKRQTLLFSATMTPNLKRLAEISMSDPYFHDTSPVNFYQIPEGLKQELVTVSIVVKDAYLYYFIKTHSAPKSSIMIFVSNRKDCETIYLMLKELELPVTQLHSSMKQEKRLQSINSFRSGVNTILVATDVASRGLDIPAVSLVINYNVPQIPENYVHRVGRTARAGRGGRAITLVTAPDVEAVLAIEDVTGEPIDNLEINEDNVLVDLNRVMKAKQAAILVLTDSGFYGKVEQQIESKREKNSLKRKPNSNPTTSTNTSKKLKS